MAMTILSGSGGSLVGNWIDIRSTVGKTYPHRITAYGAFSGGNVNIQGILGDNSIAANVVTLATLTQNGFFTLDSPMDWIRATTDSGLTGPVLVLDSTTA